MHITFKGKKIMNDYNHIKAEILEKLTKDCGEKGCVLFLYYNSKNQTYEWRDAEVALKLSWSTRTLERTKKKLKDFGWIDYWSSKGNKYMYVGRDKVEKSNIDRIEAGVKENTYFTKKKKSILTKYKVESES